MQSAIDHPYWLRLKPCPTDGRDSGLLSKINWKYFLPPVFFPSKHEGTFKSVLGSGRADIKFGRHASVPKRICTGVERNEQSLLTLSTSTHVSHISRTSGEDCSVSAQRDPLPESSETGVGKTINSTALISSIMRQISGFRIILKQVKLAAVSFCWLPPVRTSYLAM